MASLTFLLAVTDSLDINRSFVGTHLERDKYI